MNYIMIAVHKNGSNVNGFRILDIDNWNIFDKSKEEILNSMVFDGILVDNLGRDGNELVGLNGKLDRYPLLINGKLIGKSPLIIVMKMANDKFLVTNYNGEKAEVSEINAIKYSLTEGIANGKVVRNRIQSISGEYRKDRVLKSVENGDSLKSKLDLLGKTDFTLDERGYLVLNNKEVEVLRLPMGVLGIDRNSLNGAVKLKSILLSPTVLKLDDSAFSNCSKLEEIIIPEGLKSIPERCFLGCVKLKEIELPNSIESIGANAFLGCRSLKKIVCGQGKIDIKFNSIPRGIMLKRR